MRIPNGRWPCPCWHRQVTPAAKPSTNEIRPHAVQGKQRRNEFLRRAIYLYARDIRSRSHARQSMFMCLEGGGITPAWTHHSRPWLCPTCCTASARMCQPLCQPQKRPLQGDAVVP